MTHRLATDTYILWIGVDKNMLIRYALVHCSSTSLSDAFEHETKTAVYFSFSRVLIRMMILEVIDAVNCHCCDIHYSRVIIRVDNA